ncbi:cupin-like domain-containing protein [Thiocapsa marina]|uniref:Transcription factor jumonji n=1 Tax=Thiocapsa marina 5811 TaxID=768671 RepID=F9UAS8_9GAMM|nr:cupin-like domain-containing protein [Thiocapsa marina]EGV18546.1 Transcription factor jumonji [Thiocapsa marina 5811]
MAIRTIEIARSGDMVVEKKYGMTVEEFRTDHLYPLKPVVLADATAHWPARKLFTPEFFRSRFGQREIEVDGKHYPLAEFIDRLYASTPENPAPYPGKLLLNRDFPELLEYIRPRIKYSVPDRIGNRWIPESFLCGASTHEIFFGSPGGSFPYVHYDYMGLHAWINQLVGEKEFIVVPPWDGQYLYPDPNDPWKSMVGDLKHPDLDRFPLVANATVLSFVVGPGETMFIPNGWWHTTVSKSVTISVALDQLCGSNWNRFREEVRWKFADSHPAKGAVAQAYLRALGPVLSVQERFKRAS